MFLLLSSEKAADTFIMSSLSVLFGFVLGWYLLSDGGLLLFILRNFFVFRNLLLADFLDVV